MQQPFLCNIQGWVSVRLWKNLSFTCQWDRPTKVLKCLGFPHTRLTARFETREKHDQSPSPQFFLFYFYCRNPVWRVTVLMTVQLNQNCVEIKDVPSPIGDVSLFCSSSIGRVFLWDLTVNHSLLFSFSFFSSKHSQQFKQQSCQSSRCQASLFVPPNYYPPFKLNLCVAPHCVLLSLVTWGLKGCNQLKDKTLWYMVEGDRRKKIEDNGAAFWKRSILQSRCYLRWPPDGKYPPHFPDVFKCCRGKKLLSVTRHLTRSAVSPHRTYTTCRDLTLLRYLNLCRY